MAAPLTKRPYWPKLLDRVDQLLAQGRGSHEITQAISEEFSVPRQSIQIAIRRGDVPSMPSRDRARAQARQKGEIHFQGKSCVSCGGRTRYVADLRCVACESTYNKNNSEQNETHPSKPRLSGAS